MRASGTQRIVRRAELSFDPTGVSPGHAIVWFYALRRSGLLLIIIGCAMLTLFSLLHMVPGDPVTIALGPRATAEAQERYFKKMHLDEPVYKQFLIYAGNALTGDLGEDIFSERDVTIVVLEDMKYTLILALAALGWSALIGIPLGCFSAIRPNTWLDHLTGIISVGTIAVPSFLVSIWALLVFAVMVNWFPVIGAGEGFRDQVWHLVLPAFAVGLGWVGYLARLVRASMLEVMGENYIRAARAFGLPQRTIVYRYALKVAVLPTVTLVGVGFGGLLSGAVFAEIIFSRPGVGKLIFDMAQTRNFPVVQGGVLITTGLYVTTTLIADITVAALDPRVRHSL